MYAILKQKLDSGIEYETSMEIKTYNTLDGAIIANKNINGIIYEVEKTNRGMIFKMVEKEQPKETEYFFYDDRERHSRGEILEVVDENGTWKYGKVFLKLYTSEIDCIKDHDHYETFGPDPRFSIYKVKPIGKLYEDEDGHKLATKIEFIYGI